jgi:hypothetical protein
MPHTFLRTGILRKLWGSQSWPQPPFSGPFARHAPVSLARDGPEGIACAPKYDMLNLIMRHHILALVAVLTLFAATTPADEFSLNPQVKKIVDEVSEARIKAIIEHLVSFGTRHTLSNPDLPGHGIGAARQWIFAEMKGYSPRLQVRFDKWHVKKNGQRLFRDVDLYNVIAVLPGKTMPETQVVISAHYDTVNLGAPRPGGAAAGPGNDAPPAAIGERPTQSGKPTPSSPPPAPATMAAESARLWNSPAS